MTSFSLPWPFNRARRRSNEPNDPQSNRNNNAEQDHSKLLQFGFNDRLQDFLKTLTVDTFKSHPLRDDRTDDTAMRDSNVRQDLSEWQEQHATLVLSKVKEIAHLRYVLCPRHLKERDFWRIYFLLVKSYVTPYEMQAMRMKTKEAEKRSSNKSAVEVEMAEANHGSTPTMSLLNDDEEPGEHVRLAD